ncbi:GGDEF domain-containing protein [Aureimonas leprariae]|uniref:diguanylate cyclase n=1 Tax=Plantimonas leprariae TaxID=2615207 RepID=A0A7V7TYJ0_9HYPH|nr:GGDEF domain-containing protein [Aureimonas leprariae]KAB0682816.1 GGDEF domain-containing protein [Aureimonas leprariae]
MNRFGNVTRLLLETASLTAVMGVLVLVAAWHYFGNLGGAPGASVVFALGALLVCAIPVQAYIVLRFLALKESNNRLYRAATEDGLTRLLNRTAFRSGFDTELVRRGGGRRGDIQGFALLIVDADHFKKINDTLGHAVGDQALRLIAGTLRASVRADDIVGRLGGEEFGVLLKGAGMEEAEIVAERLRARINTLAVGPQSAPRRLSVSIGGIVFDAALPFDALFKVADANLYRAKEGGRNRAVLTNALRGAAPKRQNWGSTRSLAGPAPETIATEFRRRSD